MHNPFEKHDNIHRDSMFSGLSLDTSLFSDIIMPSYSEDLLYIFGGEEWK
jgi:hypothetical protein